MFLTEAIRYSIETTIGKIEQVMDVVINLNVSIQIDHITAFHELSHSKLGTVDDVRPRFHGFHIHAPGKGRPSHMGRWYVRHACMQRILKIYDHHIWKELDKNDAVKTEGVTNLKVQIVEGTVDAGGRKEVNLLRNQRKRMIWRTLS